MSIDSIADAVDAADFGAASARKRGRSPRLPYVPVIDHGDRTHNPVRGRAYATREEAVAAAQRQIDAQREDLAAKLVDPRYRALREHHGLPRELNDLSRCSDCGMVLNLEAGEGFITDDGEVTCADHYPDRDPEDLQ